MMMGTYAVGRPIASGGSGRQADEVRIGGYAIEDLSFHKLRAGILQVDQTLTVGTPGAQRVDIVGDQGLQAYSAAGTLTAQVDSNTGKIWGKSGGFGGTLAAPSWTITANGLVRDTGVDVTSAGMAPGDYPFYAGATYANRATANFRVNPAGDTWMGNLTATGGTIGGFTIGADYIRDVANSFGMASTVTGGDDVRFWAGDTFANRTTTSKVRIFESGIIHLGAAVVDYMILNGPTKSIYTSEYTSGVEGWKIALDYVEFANAYIRGELHSTIFVKDLIEAHAGSMVIAKSAGKLSADMVVPGAGTWTVTLDDPPGGGFLFANSDICRCKTEYSEGIADIWFVVSARTDNGNGTQSYTCTWQSGTRSITYPAGSPVVDYGVSGQGYLFMSADLANAPYYDVRTHAGAPWTTEAARARLGNLSGVNHPVTGAPLTGIYGLWTDSGYFTGTIVATSGTIGGWTLGATTLTGGAVTLDSAGKISLAVSASSGPTDSSLRWIEGANLRAWQWVFDDGVATNTKTWGYSLQKANNAGQAGHHFIIRNVAGIQIGGLAIISDTSGNAFTQIYGYFTSEGYIYPGTGASNQTTRYLYDAGATSGLAIGGGHFSLAGRLYPGPATPGALQTARYIYDDGSRTRVNSWFRAPYIHADGGGGVTDDFLAGPDSDAYGRFGKAASTTTQITHNAYISGGLWYPDVGAAAPNERGYGILQFSESGKSGMLVWYSGQVAGTAAFTPTERFRIDPSGNLKTMGYIYPGTGAALQTADYLRQVSAGLLGVSSSFRIDGGTLRFYSVSGSYDLTWVPATGLRFDWHIYPKDIGTYDIGNADNYWNEVNAKAFTDRGCIPHLDGGEAMSLIRKTGPSKRLADSPRMKPFALKRIQYDALPAWVYDDGKRQLPDGSVVQGEEGLDLSGMMGILLGAVKNLDVRVAALGG